MSESVAPDSFLARSMRRRSFFRVAGAAAAASTLVLAGCNPGDDSPKPSTNPNLLILGGGDNGLLNYAYLLEQLEAAFYQKVLDALPADLLPGEKDALTDLRDHEVIHREFFKQALGTNAIESFDFDFSTLTLTTRAGVFAAAKKLEDLGVAAYAGVGKLITSSVYLGLVAKIASVEARHAAYVRDAVQANSLATADADTIITTGDFAALNVALTPAQVMSAAAPFLKFIVDTSQLPKA
ncbi:ferritin-like domain-containing protein [Hymenobacter persicinus]|uniref:Ferritin-like domain-containing protein n=1 Tax=Hymenobacter persicinus TaxID=2025506 RepID=A0A4Q5LFS1_9BACT|nr:ferritin-like domain-containing protein [Hymenobacter persicinus]RYU84254.1 ferritin-like domain-containing protein [Hymenobacter persicinus]